LLPGRAAGGRVLPVSGLLFFKFAEQDSRDADY
jgi:hypothetical protein